MEGKLGVIAIRGTN